MFNGVAKVLLTSTSIAPVGLTYAWVALIDDKYGIAAGCAIGALLLALICLRMLSYAKVKLEKSTFTVSSVEAADRENLAFLLLYILPLFTANFVTLNWHIWLPIIVIFAVIIGTGYSYHFNPLLGLMGWHFYKVATPEGVTYVLITKKELRHANTNSVVVQLTEYIVLDIED